MVLLADGLGRTEASARSVDLPAVLHRQSPCHALSSADAACFQHSHCLGLPRSRFQMKLDWRATLLCRLFRHRHFARISLVNFCGDIGARHLAWLAQWHRSVQLPTGVVTGRLAWCGNALFQLLELHYAKLPELCVDKQLGSCGLGDRPFRLLVTVLGGVCLF